MLIYLIFYFKLLDFVCLTLGLNLFLIYTPCILLSNIQVNKSFFYIYFSLQLEFIKTSLSSLRLRAITYATLKHHIRQGIFIFIYCNMVSEPFRAYPSECLCWAYRATRYRTAIGPPKIYSPTHELLSITLGVRGVLEIPHRLEIRVFHCI